MNEDRIRLYLELIQQLLSCPSGEEPGILQAHRELWDEGLVVTFQAVAEQLQGNGQENEAGFLLSWAAQLAEALGMEAREDEGQEVNPRQYLEFIQGLFAAEVEGGQEAVFSVLRANQNLLDRNFSPVLENVVNDFIGEQPAAKDDIVALVENITIRIQEFPLGNRAVNQEIAIAGYHLVLQHRPEGTEKWAQTQNNLGNAYLELHTGDRGYNIQRAIECYENALRVRQEATAPLDWAMTQNNLGNAYYSLPTGDRGDNIERAIKCYENALRVRQEATAPLDWAMTQNNLGNAYSDLPTGDRGYNIERAIQCYENALRVWQEATAPLDWAITHNNLGTAYCSLPTGDRGDNIERAIQCYENALRVWQEATAPLDWAMTQNNLGNAYYSLPTGDRGDNIERAIECYENALRVWQEATAPLDWAMTQHNLGTAYYSLPTGDRGDNIERAIQCYENALRVRKEATAPLEWAMTQNNLGNAYYSLPTGDRGDNIERAIECYENALRVRKEATAPLEWATTQHNLGTAYSDLPTGDRGYNIERAIECYENALRVWQEATAPLDWATTQNNLGTAYYSLPTGDRGYNIERVIECCENALRVWQEATAPLDWAKTQNNLGTAYSDLPTGDRGDNIQRAIESYEKALKVLTPTAFPIECLRTGYNFGNLALEIQNWETAIYAYDRAIAAVEQSRYWAASELAKREIQENAMQVYFNMLQACVNAGNLGKAIETVERSKARNLVELLANRDLYPKGEIPQTIINELSRLRKAVEAEQRRLNNQRATRNSDSSSGSLTSSSENNNDNSLSQLTHQLDELIKNKITPIDPEFALTQKVDPIPYSEIQSLTNTNTALVEWYILGDSFCVFAITNNPQPRLLSFPESDLDRLIAWADEYLSSYDNYRDEISNEWRDNLSNKLETLAEILHIDEILQTLPEETKQLILIPHRYLHLFPLHALPVTKATWQHFHSNNETCPIYPHVLDCFEQGVRYTPSCQLLHQVQKYPQRPFDNLFAIQTPTEDLHDKDYGVTNAIKQQFKNRVVINKEQATKSALIRENSPLLNTHCLFFYCHGYFERTSPLESGLQLADGNLTLSDIIAHFDLRNCRLVTLSACETGQTQIDNTDEYIGLPSGFMLAGSQNLVGSLWSVNALATSLLMTKFYTELQKSDNIALALNQSQKWLRDVTVKGLQDWLPTSPLEDEWREKLTETLQEWEIFLGANHQPFNSPAYWAAFCAIGKGT